jgi:hypothetical protein
MAGEKPGSINSMAAETGRKPRDPSVLADFTHALGQWRETLIVEDVPPTMEFAGLFLERHLAGSVRALSDLQLEGDWQPTSPTDRDALAEARDLPLITDQILGMSPPADERHSCDH